MSTTTFADYAAAAEARKDIATAVLGHSYALCEALRQNFIDYSIEQHERSIDYADAGDVASVRYHEECIAKLKQGICTYNFTIEFGRKYHKIVMNDGTQRSCHAFVDKKTGQIYKSSSWKSPAKGVRFDLRLIKDREWLLENADWAGGYLYLR
jgi:hypothetical protein